MGGFGKARLGKMQAAGMNLIGKCGVTGDKQNKTVGVCDFRECMRKLGPLARIGMAHNNGGAGRKRASGGKGIGKALFIRHQRECGQNTGEPRTRIEGESRPC